MIFQFPKGKSFGIHRTVLCIVFVFLRKKDLVAVSRNLYGEFLAWQEIVKSKKTFKPSLGEKKAISRGRQEIIKGDYVTLEELTY